MTIQPRLAILQFSSRLDPGLDPIGVARGLPRFLANTIQKATEIHCEVRELQRSTENDTTEAIYLEDKLTETEAMELASGGAHWCLHGLLTDRDDLLTLDTSLMAVPGGQVVHSELLTGRPQDLGRLGSELILKICSLIAPGRKLPSVDQLGEGLTLDPTAMRQYLSALAQTQVAGRANLLAQAVATDPTFVDAGLELAQCKLMCRDFEEAEAAIIQHTDRDRISHDKLLQVSLHFYNRGFIQEASYLARKAMMWHPDRHESYLPYIQIALWTGNVGDGIKYTQRAEELAPDNPTYQAYLSLFYRFLQEPEKSVAHGERAIALGPDEALHHYALGSAKLFSGAIPDSLPHFRRALELDPHDPAAHREMALAYCETTTIEEAQAQIDKSLELLPTDAFLLTVRARTYSASDPASAEESLKLAIQHHPSFPDAHGLLGHLLRERGEYASAQEHLEKAITHDSHNPEWYRELGRLFLAISNHEQAKIAFLRAQELEE